MNELLEVRANYQLGTIEENLEEVEKSIRAYCDQYKGIVVREEDIPDTKKLLAEIRKAKDTLDAQRKDVKKAWNKPYDQFEKKVKVLLGIYDDTIVEINTQLKEYEEKRIALKKASVAKQYEELVPEELQEYLPLARIYNPKWENATYTYDKVREDICMALDVVNINISSIKGLQSKWEEDALLVLRKGGTLPEAIQKIKEMEEQEVAIKASIEAEASQKAEKPAEKAPEDVLPFGRPSDTKSSYTMIFRASGRDYQRLIDFLESTSIEFTVYEED